MIVYFKDVKNRFGGNAYMGKVHKIFGKITPFSSKHITSESSVKVHFEGWMKRGYTIEKKNIIIYDFKRYYDNAITSLKEEL